TCGGYPAPGTHPGDGCAAWPFDRPFDRLRVPSTLEGLTVPSEVEGHLDLFEQPGRKRVFQ
ncbi:MAG: hypothetical protein WCI75_15100, partial [candidate division NC10 bacterium]